MVVLPEFRQNFIPIRINYPTYGLTIYEIQRSKGFIEAQDHLFRYLFIHEDNVRSIFPVSSKLLCQIFNNLLATQQDVGLYGVLSFNLVRVLVGIVSIQISHDQPSHCIPAEQISIRKIPHQNFALDLGPNNRLHLAVLFKPCFVFLPKTDELLDEFIDDFPEHTVILSCQAVVVGVDRTHELWNLDLFVLGMHQAALAIGILTLEGKLPAMGLGTDGWSSPREHIGPAGGTCVVNDKRHQLKYNCAQMSKLHEMEKKLNEAQITLESERDSHGGSSQSTRRHLVRSVMVVIDVTKSMKLKDFKPSRIAITLQCLKFYIKKIFDINPIAYICIGIAEQGICKPLTGWSTDSLELERVLQTVKVNETGSFSLESCLKKAMTLFADVPLYSSKELLLIQSSPSTKDYGDIFEVIEEMQTYKVVVNICSLVGITFIYKKLIESCNGRYEAISDQQNYYTVLSQLTKSPEFDRDKVEIKLFKVAFCKKEVKDQATYCYCHMEEHYQIYVCYVCLAHLCKVPTECVVCKSRIILPGDLYRHFELQMLEAENKKDTQDEDN